MREEERITVDFLLQRDNVKQCLDDLAARVDSIEKMIVLASGPDGKIEIYQVNYDVPGMVYELDWARHRVLHGEQEEL